MFTDIPLIIFFSDFKFIVINFILRLTKFPSNPLVIMFI